MYESQIIVLPHLKLIQCSHVNCMSIKLEENNFIGIPHWKKSSHQEEGGRLCIGLGIRLEYTGEK